MLVGCPVPVKPAQPRQSPAMPRADPRPRPLAEVPLPGWQAVVGLFTDIDDTLTRDGVIEPPALDALQALNDAGVPVIAITGRPLGWSEPFVRLGPDAWPLCAIVAENGAVALIRDGDRVLTEYAQDEATRACNAGRLRQVLARIVGEVPGATPARDSAGRVTDIAIDHSEHSHLGANEIAQVVALMQQEGMTATVSSIHINGWFGSHDKLSAARWMVRRLFARDLDAEIARWIYVGDSTNDQLLFAHFPLSVGVANLRRFAAELHTWPAWIAQAERGEGFAEVARALLRARGAQVAAAAGR